MYLARSRKRSKHPILQSSIYLGVCTVLVAALSFTTEGRALAYGNRSTTLTNTKHYGLSTTVKLPTKVQGTFNDQTLRCEGLGNCDFRNV